MLDFTKDLVFAAKSSAGGGTRRASVDTGCVSRLEYHPLPPSNLCSGGPVDLAVRQVTRPGTAPNRYQVYRSQAPGRRILAAACSRII